MISIKDNPPLWPAEVESLGDLTGDWFVAHTKSRNEKAFVWEMIENGIPHFLPMTERTIFSGNRKRRNLIPVFSGYVFVNGDADARYTAMRTGRLCQCIDVKGRDIFVEEIVSLQSALKHSKELEFFPHLTPGRRVRVAKGPMAGVVGTIIQRLEGDASTATIVLSVTMLGVGAAVSVEPGLLVPAEEDDVDPLVTLRTRQSRYQIVEPPPRRAAV
jgi:transcriptional antiterminator RfaH